jgi:hypothetical protein
VNFGSLGGGEANKTGRSFSNFKSLDLKNWRLPSIYRDRDAVIIIIRSFIIFPSTSCRASNSNVNNVDNVEA